MRPRIVGLLENFVEILVVGILVVQIEVFGHCHGWGDGRRVIGFGWMSNG